MLVFCVNNFLCDWTVFLALEFQNEHCLSSLEIVSWDCLNLHRDQVMAQQVKCGMLKCRRSKC